MNQQRDDDTAAELQRYVKTWNAVLMSMRGRSAEEAQRWMEPFTRGPAHLVLHEPAAAWVAPALVPAEFVATLDSGQLGQLYVDLQYALDQGDAFWEPRSDDVLRQAHQRVLRVLEEYRVALPRGVASDVIPPLMPKPEALDLCVRILTRHLRRITVRDPIRGHDFDRYAQIPFAKASRLLVRGSEVEASLWWDAFGLNVAVVATEYDRAILTLGAIRSAFYLNEYRGSPPPIETAAA